VSIVFFSPRQFQVFPKLERLDANRLARYIQESPPHIPHSRRHYPPPYPHGDPYSGRPGPDRTGPNRAERPAENSPHPHPPAPSTNVQTFKPSSSSSKKNVSFYFQPLPRLPCMSTLGRTSLLAAVIRLPMPIPPFSCAHLNQTGRREGETKLFQVVSSTPRASCS
jgi:hypothetical protein